MYSSVCECVCVREKERERGREVYERRSSVGSEKNLLFSLVEQILFMISKAGELEMSEFDSFFI